MSLEEPTSTENDKIMNGDINDTDGHMLVEKSNNEQSSSQASTTTSSTSKTIYMYRNGDLYYPGKRLVVTKRAIKTWDSFLDDVTINMQPRAGAVRDIRTPMHGTRVRSLEDLMHNSRYVAVSKGEKFRLIDYEKAIDVNQRKNQKPARLKPIPRHDNKRDESPKAIENRVNQRYAKSMVIHIYRNGDPFTRAINIVLRPMEQKHMSVLVRAIEERVCLPSNLPIRRVYNMSGEKIKFACDIEDGQFYVVASNEEFQDIKYGQYLPVLRGGGKISSRSTNQENNNNNGYKQVKYLNQPRSSKKKNLSKSMDNEEDEDKSPERTNRSESQGRTPRQKQSKKETQQNRDNKTNSKSDKNQNKNSNKPVDRKKESEMTDREKAAVKIQSNFRGFSYRKKIQEGKTPDEIRQEEIEKEEIKEKEKPKEVKQKPQNKPSPRQNNKQTNKPPPEKRKEDEPKKKENPPKKVDSKKQDPKEKEKPQKVSEEEQNQTSDPNKEEKEIAASKIQAGFRGYQARKTPSEEKSEPVNKTKETPKEKAPKEEAPKKEAPKEETKKQENKKEKAKEDSNEEKPEEKKEDDIDQREESAVKIQAGVRGYLARKNMKEKDESAKKIQAACRGYLARKERKEQNEAAMKIQANYRGFQTRKSNKDKSEAASKIQAGFRGYLTRKENQEKSNAAAKIQAGFRGNKVRRDMKKNDEKPATLSPEEQVNQRQQAATKIQASFRGHAYRMKQNENKQDGKQR